VASLSVDAKTGGLMRVGSVKFPGGVVFVDSAGENLFMSAYGAGSVGVCSIMSDGKLGPITSSVQFHGHGPNKDRQEAPHPHSINVDPKSNGQFVFIPDLGLDTVFSFEISGGKFINTSYTNTTHLYAGAGPRHMAFHPTLDLAYILSEMGSTISTYKLDSKSGHLEDLLQTSHTLPTNFTGFSKAAEVVVDPTGKWLLASNRGFDFPTNSITVYEISSDGMLTERGRYPSGGTFPRGVVLDPEGVIAIVGGQDTNNIVTMKLDATTGVLTPTGYSLKDIATPVTFAFIPQEM